MHVVDAMISRSPSLPALVEGDHQEPEGRWMSLGACRGQPRNRHTNVCEYDSCRRLPEQGWLAFVAVLGASDCKLQECCGSRAASGRLVPIRCWARLLR